MNAATGTDPTCIDPEDESGMEFWRDRFGVTTEQLLESVKAVGNDPDAVQEHLLNQGASAGPS